MKTTEFKKLLREEVRKVLKEAAADDLEGLYDVIDNPAAAKLQKAIDEKYGELFTSIAESPKLNSILDPYRNRTDSFETAEDFKNFNEGLIKIFTMIIKDLNKVNSIL